MWIQFGVLSFIYKGANIFRLITLNLGGDFMFKKTLIKVCREQGDFCSLGFCNIFLFCQFEHTQAMLSELSSLQHLSTDIHKCVQNPTLILDITDISALINPVW